MPRHAGLGLLTCTRSSGSLACRAPDMADAPLALLGGTFDPVHYGHLRLANDVQQALDLVDLRLV